MPISSLDTGHRQSQQACAQTDLWTADHTCPFISLNKVDLDCQPGNPLPGAEAGVAQSSKTQPVDLFANDRRSFDLCLVTLIGLGLCRSGTWVRRLSLGFVPDWYHTGGPYQIGNSHAIEWDSLSSPPVCLVQPGPLAEDHHVQYCLGTIGSLGCMSQCSPCAYSSRGPPA